MCQSRAGPRRCNAHEDEDVGEGEGVGMGVGVGVGAGDVIEVVLFLKVTEVLGC